jgi:hypothetical protein
VFTKSLFQRFSKRFVAGPLSSQKNEFSKESGEVSNFEQSDDWCED